MNQQIRYFASALLILFAASLRAQEAAPLWETRTYAYDAAGNIIAIGDDLYRYDAVGRLAQAHTGGGAERQDFAYDVHGNLKSITAITAAGAAFVSGHAVNAATNQLNGVCGTPADVCFEGRYDAAGNQTRRDQNATLPDQYSWDPLNVLRELQTERRERYIYDANDERIAVVERPAGTDARRRYTLRGADNKVLRELVHDVGADTWTLDKDYVYRGTAVVASCSGGETAPSRHYHSDHLGSTRLITDKDGFAVARHTYWPFGRETESSDNDSEHLKFTGHERDSLPGSPGFDLDYMHARYYDPSVGRFLSVDPGGLTPQLPQSWNRYAYTMNNPVRAVDPDGKETQLVYGHPIPGDKHSRYGHVAIAINGRIYSFGTSWTKGKSKEYDWVQKDWGVPLDDYVNAQTDKRQVSLITLEISPEQEAKLLAHLEENSPYGPGKPEEAGLMYNCVDTTRDALVDTGILPAGAPPGAHLHYPFTPSGLVRDVELAGLDGHVLTVGKRHDTFRDKIDRTINKIRDWFN